MKIPIKHNTRFLFYVLEDPTDKDIIESYIHPKGTEQDIERTTHSPLKVTFKEFLAVITCTAQFTQTPKPAYGQVWRSGKLLWLITVVDGLVCLGGGVGESWAGVVRTRLSACETVLDDEYEYIGLLEELDLKELLAQLLW